jgi:hypothetical protein
MRIKLWQRDAYDQAHPENNIWPSTEYAEGEWGTPIRFSRSLRADALKGLRFLTKNGGLKPLPMNGSTLSNHQAIRSVRRLSEESAKELDRLIAENDR